MLKGRKCLCGHMDTQDRPNQMIGSLRLQKKTLALVSNPQNIFVVTRWTNYYLYKIRMGLEIEQVLDNNM